MVKIPFLGGAYTARSPNVSPQECVNYYLEETIDEPALVSTPGASLFAQASGEVRGAIEFDNKAWFVIGNTLWSYDATGASAAHGNLNTNSGLVSMAHGGTREGAVQQIIIVDGSNGYYWDNVLETFNLINDPDFPQNPSTVVFFDSYFLVNDQGTDRIYYSQLFDGSVWDGLDFLTAEGDPDALVGMVVNQRQLIVGGEITTSMFYNSGDTDQVFQRFQGGFTQTGLAAERTLQRFDNTVMWLTRNERGDAQVVRPGEGIQPQVVSSVEFSYQVSQYETISDAFAYVHQYEGHEFYVLTFPTAGVTWVFDGKEQVWHKRAHGTVDSRERFNCHVFYAGMHLMGDYENGKIYQLDSSLGTLDGDAIPRLRRTGQVSMREKRVRISSVQLDMEESHFDAMGDPSSFWLSYSKDGGHVFSNEIEETSGDTGDYAHRVIWRRLGHARNWIFQLRTWTTRPHVFKGLLAREYGEDH